MNPDKLNAVAAAASSIVAVVSLLITLAEKLMVLAGIPRDEVDAAAAEAKARAAAAAAKLNAALGDDEGGRA